MLYNTSTSPSHPIKAYDVWAPLYLSMKIAFLFLLLLLLLLLLLGESQHIGFI